MKARRPSKTRYALIVAATLLGSALCIASCASPSRDQAVSWRTDCVAPNQPAPLSLAAAHQAHAAGERRHLLRLREAAAPGSFLRELDAIFSAERVAAGDICLSELAEAGELLFEHEYGFVEGLGGGDSAGSSDGPFRRVHAGSYGGPETISCASCHWIGSPNGAGAETDNVFLSGDGELTTSGDARNPQALVALGVVQALAREMTVELQRQRDDIVREAARSGEALSANLTAKGVEFGALRVSANGEVDAGGVRGVDPDLIVKPFGWKGSHADIEDFASEALQVHLGIQSEFLLATATADVFGSGPDEADPDADGVRRELTPGPFAALIAHLALLELPIVRPLIQDRNIEPAAKGLLAPTATSFVDDFQRGRRYFHALGCAGCHMPMLVLDSPILELAGLPPIDLSDAMRRPALTYDPSVDGYPVWLFSDLRRHDMGASNAAKHPQRGVALAQYLTPRLWGVADSAPYLHDGRAPSFDYAMAGHDGEGAAARDAFAALSHQDKGSLRVYLMSLRRSPRVIVP